MHRSCDVRMAVALLLISGAAASARAQDAASERVVVTADRLPDAESSAPFSVVSIDAEELRRAPQLRLDDILRAEAPGFSLFRRNSSRTANPTTQGVTLRNFGPSGAGRTLVLLDGIPLNDPFAGYVLWSQVPVAGIDSVILQPGSGAGLFGNSALAGTIFLSSRPIETSSITAIGLAGNAETFETSIDGSLKRGAVGFELFADRFSTGGYPAIAPNQRGPIDVNASADSTLFDLRATWQADDQTSLSARARWFEDKRGNGTPFTTNRTEGSDFSVVLEKKLPAQSADVQVSAYGQRRKFRSTFSSVNANRTTETPALDQFDVPADAAGGSVVYSRLIGDHHLVVGGDGRWVEG